MNCLQAIIVGIMQGLTEFLPVSSSAHIVFAHALYKFLVGAAIASTSEEEIFFDIIVHLGTLSAILIYFKKEFVTLIKSFFEAIKKRDFSSYESKICLYILLGTFITGIVALSIQDFTEKLLTRPYLVAICLAITGFILFFSEIIAKKFSKENEKVDVKKSIFIAIAQGLAVCPGLSRSGLTIATGIACGLTRTRAAKYSFLLSVPIILGASCVYPIKELSYVQMADFNWCAIILGFLAAAIVGYFCIKYFIYYLAKYSLRVFVYYCWIVGILMFIISNPYTQILLKKFI